MEYKIYCINSSDIINHFISFIISIRGWDIIQATINNNPLFNQDINTNNDLLFKIISSVDLFLIGIVLLIFGFGFMNYL